jgi:hypothetical protein
MPDLLGGPDWKVYAVNDCEWFVARSRDEAIAAAVEHWGCKSAEEAVKHHMLDLDEVYELNDVELNALRFADSDENDERTGEWRSFKDELQRRVNSGLKEAELFACSEY